MNGENSISTKVSHLFFSGSPFAIIGFIMTISVFAFNGHAFWTFTHVMEKVLVIVPPLANNYPPASVMFIAFLIWICASRSHRHPNIIGFAFPAPVSVSVFKVLSSQKLTSFFRFFRRYLFRHNIRVLSQVAVTPLKRVIAAPILPQFNPRHKLSLRPHWGAGWFLRPAF